MKVWAAFARAEKREAFHVSILTRPIGIFAQTYEEALEKTLSNIKEKHPEGYDDFFAGAVEIPLDDLRKMLHCEEK